MAKKRKNNTIKNEWTRYLWFILLSVPIIFIQSIIYYQIKQRVPEEGTFLGIIYDNLYFVTGITMVILLIVWHMIGKLLNINEKRELR